jgi:hypothetical protein
MMSLLRVRHLEEKLTYLNPSGQIVKEIKEYFCDADLIELKQKLYQTNDEVK